MFGDHRKRLLERLHEQKACCIVSSGMPKARNADCDYRFRPASDFYYLTGFREPDSILVLLPEGPEQAVLFLRESDKQAEIWNGRRLGVERAPETLEVDAAHPIDEFAERLPELLLGHETLVQRMGEDPDQDRLLSDVLAELRETRGKAGRTVPTAWLDPGELLHEMRLFKDEKELEQMRRASRVTREAHIAAMREAAPGRNEAEIDALLEYTFRCRGGTGSAYNNIVAGGANACILHYVENDQPLKAGDLLLVDAGCEWNFYASDVTRTFPVSGSFSEEQRVIYALVLKAQKAAIELVRPGNTFTQLHERAVEVLVQGLIENGLLEGPLEEELEADSYRRFYMHKTGHWLGLDVHDCGAYTRDGSSRVLEPGMVTTVEPGLYIAVDDTSVERRWRGIGVRIEDDLLVTATGHENLSAEIPKEIDEIEALCQGCEPVETPRAVPVPSHGPERSGLTEPAGGR